MNYTIIDNIFQIKEGDVLQICENNCWTNLGKINNKRWAALDLSKHNFIISGKPARVIRYILYNSSRVTEE